MQNEWILFTIEVPAPAVDLACALLTELGCGGTVVEERELDTFVPPDPDQDLRESYQLKAYFEQTAELPALRQQLNSALAELRRMFPDQSFQMGDAVPVRQEDWAENWKQNFSTLRIGQRLVVKPSWEEFAAGPQDRVIEIDPGMAFGTGSHGTTLLCLEAIAELFAGSQPPASLLDVGTGSGILALGAVALGCDRVLACDIDPEACRVAAENIANNGYSEQIRITSEPLEQLSGQFDLVVANILAEENVRLGQALLDRLAPRGWLLLSGILREKEEFVRAGFAAFPLEAFPTQYQDDWVCLRYRKR